MNIVKILVTGAVIMIYFQVYWHYWFVKMLGSYIVNTLLPIMVIFLAFIVREFVYESVKIKKRKTQYILIPLFLYVLFASSSIILNEQGFNDIKRYHIYIFSPVIIFIGISGIYIYRKNEAIKSVLKNLFIFGIIFSIYVFFTYSLFPSTVSEMTVLETNRGEVSGNTGGSYGIDSLENSVIRYTIPGISSTTYGPFLAPLIFIGFYLRKSAVRELKIFYTVFILFLVFCIFKTVSRGPVIALIAGTAYLAWWRWFNPKQVIFAGIILVISFLTFAKMIFLRLLMTLAAFFPINVSYLVGYNVSDHIAYDPRRLSIGNTLSHIGQHPFWGMGMSNLIEAQNFAKEHNNYLSIAASFGLLTLVFYMLFVILLFIMVHNSIKKVSNNQPMRDMGIILGAGLLALMVYLNFAPAEFHFIWVWFGLTAAWLRNCEDKLLLKQPLPNA